jgi:hypothetical protein
MRLIAMLDSITDTLTLKGEYAYANEFYVRLRASTDHDSTLRLVGTALILRGDKQLGLLSGFRAQTG